MALDIVGPEGGASWLVLPLIGASILLGIVGLKRLNTQYRFLCVLALAGLAALLWSETIWAGFLGSADHSGFDDFKRQDTVFKFGLQCWFLWGTASAAGLWLVLSHVQRWKRAIIVGAFAPLALVMLLSSLAVVRGRTRSFERWDGWDGWAHLSPAEQAAATWLQENARPGDYILEAEQKEGGDFSDSPRFAHATGIPTVIGPRAHSFYWSPVNSGKSGDEWDAVFHRKDDVRLIYTTPDAQEQDRLLRQYKVRFIVVGELEHREYPNMTFGKLPSSHIRPIKNFGSPFISRSVIIYEYKP